MQQMLRTWDEAVAESISFGIDPEDVVLLAQAKARLDTFAAACRDHHIDQEALPFLLEAYKQFEKMCHKRGRQPDVNKLTPILILAARTVAQ